MQNTVHIPKFLREIHGQKSNWFDIVSVHLMALVTVGVVLFLSQDMAFGSWKKWTLIALAYDLGGGVLANFTYSTQTYYEQYTQRRFFLLSMHFLHPIFLAFLFPDLLIGIVAFSCFTVASSFVVNSIKASREQLTLGVALSLLGIIMLHTLPVGFNSALRLLLTLFLLKLPLSFSVRWYRLPLNENYN